MIKPIARSLLERSNIKLTVLGLTTARSVLEEAGIKSLGFRDLVRANIDSEALALGEKMLGDHAN
ncbi:hypothetical protein OAT01_15710, partial [Pseudomonadales bacterium]|nr:hypothetical protein [Pseudomonadales bacterium]